MILNSKRWAGLVTAKVLVALAVVGTWATTNTALAQGTTFTYQGRLVESNAPANGSFEFEFILCDAAAGGSNLGINTREEVPVTGGLFTVELDFGAAAFNGAPRWLEIYVRNDSAGGSAAMLSPRHPLTATPYAITAATATDLAGNLPTSRLSGTIASSQLADGAVTGVKIFDGSIGNADISGTASIADTKLATIASAGKVANSATTATSLNSPDTIVMRNATGSFSANVITATAFSGNGADLTGLDAGNIDSGILDNARLSTNVTLLGATIDPSELSKPYRSGTIDSQTEETAFWRMVYPVTFPQAFSAVPQVTLGLNTSDLTVLETLKVSVTSKSATGFTASAIIPIPSPIVAGAYTDISAGVVGLSVNGTPGVFYTRNYPGIATNTLNFTTLVSNFWQTFTLANNVEIGFNSLHGAMIQGHPAVVYCEEATGAVKYLRASNAEGTLWGAPVTVAITGSTAAKPSLAEVSLRPAIVFLSTNVLRYIRANNSTGSTWGSTVNVDTNVSAAFLTVINNNPAICGQRNGLVYCRANDTQGNIWGAPVLVQADDNIPPVMTHGMHATMTTVNGRPAIAYMRGPDFIQTYPCYIRANDANGTSWGEPYHFSVGTALSGRQSLIVTDERPAICFGQSGSPQFIHATDPDGTNWGPRVHLDSALAPGDDYTVDRNNLSMTMIAGKPSVFYNVDRGSYSDVKFIQATVPQFQIDWTAITP